MKAARKRIGERNMKKKFSDCVILFGGNSEERRVSVGSAQNLSSQIPEAKLWFLSREGNIHEINGPELAAHKNPFMVEFVPLNGPHYFSVKESVEGLKGKTVIIALHGTEGEDGTLQKIFEDAHIAFTGTGSHASSLSFDKVETKNIARKNHIPVVEEMTVGVFTSEECSRIAAFFNQHKKIVLKPSANGSSVGLFIISTIQELKDAFKTIKEKNLSHYLAEPFITGREITVGIRHKANGDISPLPCSEVRVIQGRQFDYEGKYLGSGVEELTPAPISEDETKKCQDIALRVHKMMGCKGYSRTDMILTHDGPILLEINTLPGLSRASFIPQQLRVLGEDLRTFFQEQINL